MRADMKIDDSAAQSLLANEPSRVRTAMRGAANDGMTYVLAIQRRYPDESPRGAYRRTFTLQRSWSGKIVENGDEISAIVGSNGNMAPYNRRVQDETKQARVHRGRWTNTIQATARSAQPHVQRFYENRLRARGGASR